ncbi:hypothetical protein JTB14_011890 [Gonioctena quinquepunctata]|nr:hypothetical protein JTB14_011890 [Gonioctena quinquepunctata]
MHLDIMILEQLEFPGHIRLSISDRLGILSHPERLVGYHQPHMEVCYSHPHRRYRGRQYVVLLRNHRGGGGTNPPVLPPILIPFPLGEEEFLPPPAPILSPLPLWTSFQAGPPLTTTTMRTLSRSPTLFMVELFSQKIVQKFIFHGCFRS